ncbi:MAG: cyss: cysteine--trna ligase, partial [Akkermansiaceae bacterium]|nr:cyss: cysteine--trna ligase [Akkermansiaceae bacterium]
GGHFAAHWFHIAHLLVDGGKMSKSVGNLYTIDDLAEKGFSAMEVRYVLIGAHYRKPLNFTLESLSGAREAMAKLAKGAKTLAAKAPAEARFDAVDFGPFQSAWDALNDDLNTAGALGGLFTGLRDAAKLEGDEAAKALAAFNRVLRALGLVLPEEEPEAEVPAEIRALAEERWAVRSAKDWAQADAMRQQLAELGWIMKDGKDGYDLTSAGS